MKETLCTEAHRLGWTACLCAGLLSEAIGEPEFQQCHILVTSIRSVHFDGISGE